MLLGEKLLVFRWQRERIRFPFELLSSESPALHHLQPSRVFFSGNDPSLNSQSFTREKTDNTPGGGLSRWQAGTAPSEDGNGFMGI